MSNLYAPFRYDYVGSFLRPAELKKARADYEAGAITADQLKAVEENEHRPSLPRRGGDDR